MTFMTMINDHTGDDNDDNMKMIKRTTTLLITKTLMFTFPASFPAASATGLEVERHR